MFASTATWATTDGFVPFFGARYYQWPCTVSQTWLWPWSNSIAILRNCKHNGQCETNCTTCKWQELMLHISSLMSSLQSLSIDLFCSSTVNWVLALHWSLSSPGTRVTASFPALTQTHYLTATKTTSALHPSIPMPVFSSRKPAQYIFVVT